MLPCDFIKTGLYDGYFSKYFSEPFRHLYLSREPNNYCFDRAALGQLSKCNWENAVTD